MADLADVERAIVAQIAAALFPAGGYLQGSAAVSSAVLANAPSNAAPANGTAITLKLYRGWPVGAALDADLLANVSHVTVFPEPGMTRIATRYALQWFAPTPSVVTLTASVSGPVVTFRGLGGLGQVAMVTVGHAVSSIGYSYRLLAGDGPADVARALSALLPGSTLSIINTAGGYYSRSGWAGGGYGVGAIGYALAGLVGDSAAVTIPTLATVTAGVGADTTALLETRRQSQGFKISIWTPTPWARDAVAALVDNALSAMTDAYGNFTEFMTLPNGETARLQYRSTFTNDKPGKAHLWRRDLCWTAEYGTTIAQTQPAALGIGIGLAVNRGGNNVPALTTAGVEPPTPNITTDGDGNIMTDAAGNIMMTP